MTTIKRIAASPAIILGAALATRLASATYILSSRFGPQLLFVRNEPSHIAAALVSGLGFSSPYAGAPNAPTAQQPPLYPLILAGIFKLFGICTVASAWTAVLVNVLAGAVTAVLLYFVGRLHFGETVGILAAWLWVLPWMYQTNAFSVSLTTAYLAALGFTALLLWVPKRIEGNRRWLVLGICSGLLVLFQPALLTVVLVYGGWLAVSKGSSPRILIALAGLLLTLAPWTVRNYVTFERFIPLRDNLGLELWLGNRPGMQGTVDFSGDFPDVDPSNYARLGELAFMDGKLDASRKFILSDPAAFVGRVLRRMVEFWYAPYPFPWIAVSILGWLGATWAIRKDRNGWVWLIMLTVFPLVYYVTHNFPTYRHPIEPLIVLLAANAIVEIIARAKKAVATKKFPIGR
ncbi:MAG TPA: glycosyltransferase family 39 protein [Terriglobales bacterium]|nr:glycosyltransferase family 39 protein [Terriglobales bacterium]